MNFYRNQTSACNVIAWYLRAVICQGRERTDVFELVSLIQIPLSVGTAGGVCPNALHLHRSLNAVQTRASERAGERAGGRAGAASITVVSPRAFALPSSKQTLNIYSGMPPSMYPRGRGWACGFVKDRRSRTLRQVRVFWERQVFAIDKLHPEDSAACFSEYFFPFRMSCYVR